MELTLRDIYKSFGPKEVLKGISLRTEGGRAFGLLGRNGAGKTTTIRILMNVFAADSGQVCIDGKPADYSRIRFGYLPEERGLYPKKKIIDQLTYFAELNGMKHKDALATVDKWLQRVGMAEHRNKRLDTLSKGNQQKIQLITALAHDPQIVILDEPFSGLDPVNAMLLEEIVKEEIQKGKIVLFSSHQMNYIEEFCDEIAILNGGKVVLQGSLAEIKRTYPRNRLVVRSLQADEIAQRFAAQCSRTEDGALLLTMRDPEEKAQTMQALTEQFDIDEIKVFEPSLNDIFVQYTKEQI